MWEERERGHQSQIRELDIREDSEEAVLRSDLPPFMSCCLVLARYYI